VGYSEKSNIGKHLFSKLSQLKMNKKAFLLPFRPYHFNQLDASQVLWRHIVPQVLQVATGELV
jgi:hypothetical protein